MMRFTANPWFWIAVLMPTLDWNSPVSLKGLEHGESTFDFLLVVVVALLMRGSMERVRRPCGTAALAARALGNALLMRVLQWFLFLNVPRYVIPMCGWRMTYLIGDLAQLGWIEDHGLSRGLGRLWSELATGAFVMGGLALALIPGLLLARTRGAVGLAARIGVHALPWFYLCLFTDISPHAVVGPSVFWLCGTLAVLKREGRIGDAAPRAKRASSA